MDIYPQKQVLVDLFLFLLGVICLFDLSINYITIFWGRSVSKYNIL